MAAGKEEENEFCRIFSSSRKKQKGGQRERDGKGQVDIERKEEGREKCHCCVNIAPFLPIPLILHNSFFWLIKKPERFSFFFIFAKDFSPLGAIQVENLHQWPRSLNISWWRFLSSSSRSPNAAIQKKSGGRGRETPIVRVLLWFRRWPNDDDGQTRCPELVM